MTKYRLTKHEDGTVTVEEKLFLFWVSAFNNVADVPYHFKNREEAMEKIKERGKYRDTIEEIEL